MKKYELLYILRPDLEEDARKKVVESLSDLLTKNGAKVNKTEEWGLKQLAYEIKKFTKSYYVLVKFEAEKAALDEFDRMTKINQNVLRFLITVDYQ